MTENTNQTLASPPATAPKAASSSGNPLPMANPLAPLATLRPPLRAMRARCSARYCNPRS